MSSHMYDKDFYKNFSGSLFLTHPDDQNQQFQFFSSSSFDLVRVFVVILSVEEKPVLWTDSNLYNKYCQLIMVSKLKP